MGADLISYAIAVPDNDKLVARIVKKEAKRIKAWLDVIAKQPSWAGLSRLGVNLDDYLNDTGGYGEPDNDMDPDEIKEIVLAVRQAIIDDVAMALAYNGKSDIGRDCGYWRGKVRGCKVRVMYAGDMSWGDTPDGAGYELLQALCRLGIAEKLEALVAKR